LYFFVVIFRSSLHFVSFIPLILAIIIYCVYTGANLGVDGDTNNEAGTIHRRSNIE